MGGIGIPIASQCADAAFTASVGSSWPLQPLRLARAGFEYARIRLLGNSVEVPSLTNNMSISVVSPPYSQSQEFNQKRIVLESYKNLKAKIMAQASLELKTLILGRSCKGASYWLTCVPNSYRRTQFDPVSFRALLKFSIGKPIAAQNSNCPDCHMEQDRFGYHALACKNASGSIDRHNAVVDAICGQLRKAKVSFTKEAFDPRSENRERPGDIFIPSFDSFGDGYFDVSVIHILANAYLRRASTGQLEGSRIRYDTKVAKYPNLGRKFKPLVVECTGGWHPQSFVFLKAVANRIAGTSMKSTTDILNELLVSCAVALQRFQGNTLVRKCLGL